MERLLGFLSKWHILFIIISVILIFALIGYFVEKKRHKASPFKIASEKNKIEEINVQDLKNMDQSMSLSDALNKNVTIKPCNQNNQTSGSTPQQ